MTDINLQDARAVLEVARDGCQTADAEFECEQCDGTRRLLRQLVGFGERWVAEIERLDAQRCEHPSQHGCARQWEADHQRAALERHGLANEFPYGCDAIDQVATALVKARMAAASHDLVKRQALHEVATLEQTVIRQRDLMSRLKDRADIARENCATADARAKETVQQQMAELRGTNASLREDIEHQQAEARRLQSDLIQLLANLRVIAGLSPADAVQVLDDALNLFMVPAATGVTAEESAEEEATTP